MNSSENSNPAEVNFSFKLPENLNLSQNILRSNTEVEIEIKQTNANTVRF